MTIETIMIKTLNIRMTKNKETEISIVFVMMCDPIVEGIKTMDGDSKVCEDEEFEDA